MYYTKKIIYAEKILSNLSMQLLLSSTNPQVTISMGCANGTQFMIGDPVILLMKTLSYGGQDRNVFQSKLSGMYCRPFLRSSPGSGYSIDLSLHLIFLSHPVRIVQC